MSDNFLFELVSPEKKLASTEANSILVPGIEGDFTALPNHSTFLTTLRPGILTIYDKNGETKFIVTGGFVEILDNKTTVLAEKSFPLNDFNHDEISNMINEAKDDLENCSEESRSRLELRLNDFLVLSEIIAKK